MATLLGIKSGMGNTMGDKTVLVARRIYTMDARRPVATHLAHHNGRILAIGGAEECPKDARIDTRFADSFLIPGFVEGHSHFMEGRAWSYLYLGFFDRQGPDGRVHPGLKTKAAVLGALAHAAATTEGAVIGAWAFDPIYLSGTRLTLEDLDGISRTLPVIVTHASGHIITVNSVVLTKMGITTTSDQDGMLRQDDGQISGELTGPDLINRAQRVVGESAFSQGLDVSDIRSFASIARRAGVTTAADLFSDMSDKTVTAYRQAAEDNTIPLRMVPALGALLYPGAKTLERLREVESFSHEKLYFGAVKLILDGSIQGFTARLRWPGYHNGAPNGLWYVAPPQLEEIVERLHAAGVQLHIHTNGDEATELAVNVLGRVLAHHPRPDHRHTLQHCQLADPALFRRIAALGLCCNLFSNHIFYWGDQHVEKTLGLARAKRMNAARTALDHGIALALHSDAPVTPLAPLFTAWCAVERLTASGHVLGAEEAIGVDEALRAVTLGAAYTLHLDHAVGSLEVGKFADMAVLDSDPFAGPAADLWKVGVRGTVFSGQYFAADAP